MSALPTRAPDAPLAANAKLVYDGRQRPDPRPVAAVGALEWPMSHNAGRQAQRNEAGPADGVLLAAVRGGSEAALKTLYDRYASLVYTVALRMVGDSGLAQEVLQDVFLRCWERADTYRAERGHVGGWLIRIARNRAIDLLRSSQHQARLREQWALDGAEVKPGPADPLEQLALRHAVKTALEALPSAQRRTIELAYYSGFTQSEIAEVTATPLGTVKTRIRDGMLRLRSLLQPFVDQECAVPEELERRRG